MRHAFLFLFFLVTLFIFLTTRSHCRQSQDYTTCIWTAVSSFFGHSTSTTISLPWIDPSTSLSSWRHLSLICLTTGLSPTIRNTHVMISLFILVSTPDGHSRQEYADIISMQSALSFLLYEGELYSSLCSKVHHLKLLHSSIHDKTLSALSTPPQDTVLLPLRPLFYTLSLSSLTLMSYRLHVVTLVHLLSQIHPDFLSARVTLCAQHHVCTCRTTRPTVHVANWLAAIDGESYSSIYLLLPLPCPPPNSGQALLERTTTYTFPVFASLFEKPFSWFVL